MQTATSIKKKTSEALFEEAKKYFPGGVHSPVRAFQSVGGNPIFMKKGEGSRIIDEDGNSYLDFCGSWGPLILGHANPFVTKHIEEALANGTSFGAPTRYGNLLGRLIVDNHHFIEKIRFVNSGTEAVMSAVRLARGFTGKRKVIKFDGCYHGHVDSLMVKAGSGLATSGISTSDGIPESFIKKTLVLPLDDLENLEEVLRKLANDIACAIIEPIPANHGLLVQKRSFLSGLKNLCEKYQVLLIFDEVISGFRVGFEGAAGYYGVKPDIITFGKIIGGGLPVGAYAGSKEIMSHVAPEGNVYQAGTLSANPLTMAAGYATLKKLCEPGFYKTLNKNSRQFVASIEEHIKAKNLPVRVIAVGSIFWFSFSGDIPRRASDVDAKGMGIFKKLYNILLERGIYFGPSGYEVGFISSAHTSEDLAMASSVICAAMDEVFI